MSEEIFKEIREAEQKVRELKAKLKEKTKFKHNCPNCGAEWFGWKEKVKSCTFCHNRFVRDPENSVSRGADVRKRACEKLDKDVRVKGKLIVNEVHVFAMVDGNMEYSRIVDDVETDKRRVNSTLDVIGSWTGSWKGCRVDVWPT